MAHETEIKLRVADPKELRVKLKALGARMVGPGGGRVRESNVLFDTSEEDLQQRGLLASTVPPAVVASTTRVRSASGPAGVISACAWASLESPIQAAPVRIAAATARFTLWPPAVSLGPPRWRGRSQGLFHEILKAESLLERAKEVASRLASAPMSAFESCKHQLRQPFIERAGRFSADYNAQSLEQWGSPETHAIIRAYVEKTIRKK